MNTQKLIGTFLLFLPGLSLAQPAPSVPEPNMLALLGAGGIVVGAIALFRRRK